MIPLYITLYMCESYKYKKMYRFIPFRIDEELILCFTGLWIPEPLITEQYGESWIYQSSRTVFQSLLHTT